MLKKATIFGLLTFWVMTAVVLGEPIAVLNPSFEYVGSVPVGVKTMGVEPDDWSFGNGMPTGGGIEAASSDGDVCVAVYNVDSIYQLLDYSILSGDEYTLEFDTYYLWASGSPYDCTFQGRLYYDDSGSRTVIDYVEANLTDSGVWHYDYTLNTTIPSGHAAIGKNLGIELTTDQGSGGNSWFGFDNVRLDVIGGMGVFNPDPADEQTGVSLNPTLSWQVTEGFTDPNFQVYFSDDEDDVTGRIASAFKGSQYETTYSPTSVQPGTYYYWCIDILDNSILYPGPVWQFSTEVELPNCLQVLPADLNDDCEVNITDVLIMAEQWCDEYCTPPWCADIDPTDGVGLPDFAMLSADWLKSVGGVVVINEFMASNTTVLLDDDSEYPDWIEIKNRSGISVNLDGWYLTDDIEEPDKWQLPDVSIESGEFLVIFASSKDRSSDPNYPLHTNFNLDIRGEYLGLYRPDETVADEFIPHFPTQAEDISYGLTIPFGEEEYTYGYFLEPTPGAENSISVSNLGPYIEDVVHSPSDPCETDSIVVTATITPKLKPVDSVSLYYRVMYGGETSINMYDDGTHDDGFAGDGVYGATIPSGIASPGQMIRYYITAVDPNTNSNRSPLSLDLEGMRQSPEYHGMVVKDPALTSNIAILHWFVQDTAAADSTNRIGTRASLYYNEEFYDNIYVRVRGGSIMAYPNKSYKFEFNRGYYFRFSPSEARVDEFNLSSTYPDKAYIRQDIAFESFRDAGEYYCETFPMRVQRNDQFFSVGIFIEQVDGEYLERQGLDPEGALYKMYSTMDSTNGEKKTREYEDYSDLQALVNGVALTGTDLEKYLFDNLNLPSIINYAAVNTIINEIDHGAKNYYAYRDTNGSGEWLYLPWDKDLTFGKQWSPTEYLLDDTLFYYNRWSSPGADDLQNGGNNVLLAAIYSRPRTNEMYHRRLRTLADQLLQAPGTPYAQRHYETRLDELEALMTPDTALHYNKWANPWYGEDQSFAQAIAYLKTDYLDDRRTHIYIDHSVSNGGNFVDAQVGNPTINIGTIEFNPASGNQDEEYIELTNPNSDAVDISGWKLTGGVYFTFEPGTVIPAGETMYVSPDLAAFRARSTSPKGNEANFVRGNYSGHLSSWGETVNLLAADDTLIDTVTYAGAPSDQQRYLRITEMMYHPVNPVGPSPYNDEDFEYVELMNIGPTELDLEGVRFTNGISFAFASGETSSSDTLIDITDSWRYEETDTDLGTSWRAYGYDDSLWPQGDALLYNEGSGLPAPKNTLLDLGPGGDRTRTFYFRKHFNLNADPAIDTITLELNTVIDDGAVFYLNGTEVYRLGMHPTDVITHSTFANRTIGEAVYEGPFAIPTSSLLQGDNVIAVEVHQTSSTSSDVVFGLTLDADIVYNNPAESSKIGPSEIALLVKSSLAFESRYGTGYNILGQYTGSLSNGGEEIKLEDPTNSTILEFDYNDSWYDITDGEGFSLTIVDVNDTNLDMWDDKDGWRPSTVSGGTPGTDDKSMLNPGDIVINEILAHSDVELYDWIELHNTTDKVINIGGWFLSDNNDDDPNRMKYKIASGTTIDPNDYIVFYENLHFGNPSDPSCNVPYALSENGETLYLQSGQGGVLTGYYDDEDFGASEPDVAFGRYYKESTDSYNFVAMSANTPDNPNAYPKVGPIVINEIMYNPDLPGGSPYDNDEFEYIELYNTSGSSKLLETEGLPWKFTDGVDFTFPPSTTIPVDGYLLVVRNPAAFAWRYGTISGVEILGPYENDTKLSNGGEKLELSMPGDLDDGVRQYIRIDRVNYDDEGLWPTGPDGNGDSLTRKNSTLYGNDVANWQSASPTPGQ